MGVAATTSYGPARYAWCQLTLPPIFRVGNVPFLNRCGLGAFLFPLALGEKRRDRKGSLGLASNTRGGGLGGDPGDCSTQTRTRAPLPSAAPEARTIALPGGAGEGVAGGRSSPPGAAPGPPPALAHRLAEGSHRRPPRHCPREPPPPPPPPRPPWTSACIPRRPRSVRGPGPRRPAWRTWTTTTAAR